MNPMLYEDTASDAYAYCNMEEYNNNKCEEHCGYPHIFEDCGVALQ
jgi:hypothetical protein